MRLLAGKGLARNLLQQSFANADAGNREGPQIQIAAERDEGDRGDAHDIGAVAAHGVGLHAFADVPFLLEVPGFEDTGPDKQNVEILKAIEKNTEVTLSILRHVEVLIEDHVNKSKEPGAART